MRLTNSIPEPTTFEAALTALADAHSAITELRHDPRWDMLNASGLAYTLRRMPNGRYGVIVLDLDDMRGMNDRYSHKGLDERMARISRALALRHSDIVRGRIQWGDEVAIILPSVDVPHAALRLLADFVAEGLSATIAYVTDAENRYEDAIERTQAAVEELKRQGRRGTAVNV